MREPILPSRAASETTAAGPVEKAGASPLFAVPGAVFGAYEVVEQVYSGRRSVVLRCLRASERMVVKLLRSPKLGPGEVARFRREYELSRRVVHANVVRAESLESHAGVLFLAMADDGAVSVRDLLRHGPLPLADALHIAIAVVSALEAIHLRNIIHKDISPGNIITKLAGGQGGTVRLIDFGISADVSFERPQATSLRELEGTLAYMAPEQTGRMNRDLDYRADFYALGATLYELLAGTPPFGHSRDPVEAVHAHLALPPPPVQDLRADTPPALAALLARLLAKEPEARYQNHHVLGRDLRHILQYLADPAPLAGLRLGQGDLAERFQVSGRLYGRAEEVRQMMAAFEAAAVGVARVVTIAGASGIGKTALVQEVHRSLLGHRGHLVHGKFDQFGQHTPGAAFLQALEQRIRRVLALPPAEQAAWRSALRQQLGANIGVAQAALPALGVLLGDGLADAPAPAATLGPAETENRFLRSLQLCFAALASPASPLVVFIDDLQWADRISRRMLRELALDEGLRHVLLIGAYRAGEVPPDHPLAQDLAALAGSGGSGARHTALEVGPLKVHDVAELLADSLQQPLAEVEELARLCHSKTSGNPFFLGRFLEDLHRRHLIWLDRSVPRWRWSQEHLHAERVADNVVELMLEQLRRLPPATGALLTSAAFLGSRFLLAHLAVACEQSESAVVRALGPALEAGLLVPQDASYKWIAVLDAAESQGLAVEFAFVHDRVQEAAYLLASAEERPALHLHIGRLLRDGPAGTAPAVAAPAATLYATGAAVAGDDPAAAAPEFAVVNHLNQGSALMFDVAERAQLAGFNLGASHQAQSAASFDLAADYAAHAIALYGPEHWLAAPAAALDLHVHAARMAALKGDAAAMDSLIEAALEKAPDAPARARLLDVRIESFYASGRLDETLELGLAVLRLLGTEPPAAATPAQAAALVAALKEEIAAIGFDVLAKQPAMTDALCLQQLNVTAKMTAAAYIARPALLPLLTVLQVRLMVARGHAPVALSAYSVMGLMVAEFLGDYVFGYRLGRMSMDLLERHHWRHVHAHAGFSFNAFLRHWTEGIASGLPALMQVHHDGLETGSLRHAGLSLYVHDYHDFLNGRPLAELEADLDHHATTLRRIRQPVAHDYLSALRGTVRALRQPRLADTPLESASFSAEALAATYSARADQTGAMFLQAWRCMLHTLAGQADEAVRAGDAAEQLFSAGRGMVMVPFCVFFTAVAALAQIHRRDDTQTRCNAALVRLQRWAATCADVRPLLHLLRARVLQAGLLADAGTTTIASTLGELQLAQQAAEPLGNLLLLGLVHWYRGEALAHDAGQAMNTTTLAAAAAERDQARATFLRWGGRAVVDAMDRQATPVELPVQMFASETSVSVPGSALDLSTLMKSVQAVTAEMALDVLLSRLVYVLRENAGASRAAIVLGDSARYGDWYLQADSGLASGPRVMEGLPLEDAGPRLPREVLRTVLNTAGPVLVDDASTDPAWCRLPYFAEGDARSVLCMPLVRQGRVLGALYLENDAVAGAFSPERILFLELLSGNVVNAIDNARLYAELRALADTLEQRVAERTRELRESEERTLAILHNAPLPMTVTRESDNVFVYVNELAAKLAGMPAAELLGTAPLTFYHAPQDRERMLAMYRRDGVVRDYQLCMRGRDGQDVWLLISMVPILYDGQPSALSTVTDITERKSMEDALRQAATTDSLTGMASRSHFMERAEVELGRARRHARPLAMVMLDVDHFKQINDRHGHATGDEVLRLLTQTCRATVRQQDIVGRLGGEEFGILMPETDQASAVALAERLRLALAALQVNSAAGAAHAGPVRVTASFGVSAWSAGDTLDGLLARADAGLYLSKHAGRNRVSCADVSGS